MLRTITFTIILTLCFAAPPALAKCPSEAKAKALYATGAKHYNAKKYPKAIEAFTKAQKLCPTVAMLYNLARAHDLVGDKDAALMLYKEYLKLKDPKATTGDIEKRIKALRADAASSWTNPFEPEPRKSEPPKKQKTLDCLPKEFPQKPQEPRWKRLWAWVATGAGVALLGTGTALLATRRVNEWRRNEDTGKLESVTDSVVPGAVLAGASAVAVGLGVWLFVRQGEETQEPASQVKVGLIPTASGISIEGVF